MPHSGAALIDSTCQKAKSIALKDSSALPINIWSSFHSSVISISCLVVVLNFWFHTLTVHVKRGIIIQWTQNTVFRINSKCTQKSASIHVCRWPGASATSLVDFILVPDVRRRPCSLILPNMLQECLSQFFLFIALHCYAAKPGSLQEILRLKSSVWNGSRNVRHAAVSCLRKRWSGYRWLIWKYLTSHL